MNRNILLNGKEYRNIEIIKATSSADPNETYSYIDTIIESQPATAAQIKYGFNAFVNNEKVTGSLKVYNYYSSRDISDVNDVVEVEAETVYENSWQVKIDPIEQQKIIGSNIRQGVTILGVPGTLSPTEGVNAQSKNVTPTKSSQIVSPDDGYNYLSEVLVEPIPPQYIVTDDADATANDILIGKSAYVNGEKVIGQHTDPQISISNNVMIIR